MLLLNLMLFFRSLMLFSALYLLIPDLKLFLDLLGFDKLLMDNLLIFCLLLNIMALNERESTFFEILLWRRWISIDNYWLLSCSFVEKQITWLLVRFNSPTSYAYFFKRASTKVNSSSIEAIFIIYYNSNQVLN